MSSRIPLTCKLTDFEESRSQEVYTNTIISTKTKNINRGYTCVYDAGNFSKRLSVNFSISWRLNEGRHMGIWLGCFQFDKSRSKTSIWGQHADMHRYLHTLAMPRSFLPRIGIEADRTGAIRIEAKEWLEKARWSIRGMHRVWSFQETRDKGCTRSSKCQFYQSTYIFSDCFRGACSRRSTSYIIVRTSTFKFPRFCKVREVSRFERKSTSYRVAFAFSQRAQNSLANIAREWLTFLKTVLYVSFMSSKLKLPIIHN